MKNPGPLEDREAEMVYVRLRLHSFCPRLVIKATQAAVNSSRYHLTLVLYSTISLTSQHIPEVPATF